MPQSDRACERKLAWSMGRRVLCNCQRGSLSFVSQCQMDPSPSRPQGNSKLSLKWSAPLRTAQVWKSRLTLQNPSLNARQVMVNETKDEQSSHSIMISATIISGIRLPENSRSRRAHTIHQSNEVVCSSSICLIVRELPLLVSR